MPRFMEHRSARDRLREPRHPGDGRLL